MKIYKYLCDKDIRESLEQYLMENAPEIIECDINRRDYSYLQFKKCEHYKKYRKGHFQFTIQDGSNSYMCLWDNITEDTELSSFRNREMGYHAGKGNLYPNLDIKVQGLIKDYIKSYIREERLKQLLDE